MRCIVHRFGDGVAVICGRGRVPVCRWCRNDGVRLCDFPLGGGKTCDAPICRRHALQVGPETDVCPNHRRNFQSQQGSLFGT